MINTWLEIHWAILMARIYTMFHLTTRVYIENTWREDRREFDLYGDPLWVEVIQFVAVVKGSILTGNLRVIKVYYGRAHFELTQLNGVK
jgi:hypothetical protein